MEFINPEKKYLELAEKWLNNTITPQEEIKFSEWYNANQDNVVILSAAFAQNEDVLKKRILQNIQKRKEKTGKEISMRSHSFIRAAAAAILILLAGGAWYYFHQKPEAGIAKNDSDADRFKNDMSPGGDKAVLTLADGSKIILDNAKNGTLAQQGNTKIIILDAGQLAYNSQGVKTNGEVLYNTISTPKGGQYQVILPDGSKVWLNAASSLRFPTAFVGKQRNVEMTGEAYFEVMPLSPKGGQKMPFIVQVNSPATGGDGGMNVQVLGTHFNVMAYNDELDVKTTLLEGGVKVTKGTAVGLLKPGQQAKTGKNTGNIKISTADTEEAVAWKNGLFDFNNEDIGIIMRQIERWYDVEVSFRGNIANRNFTGFVSRNSNVSQVLKKLELTGEVHFKIEGKKIAVLP